MSPSKFIVIPAIDILNGQVVRLRKGDYNQVEEYKKSGTEIATEYEASGVQRIHIIDLDGAKDGQLQNLALLKEIRKLSNIEIEFGGGVRHKDTVDLLIKMGINYIILGSMLINDFEMAKDIIESYPGQIIAGIDAKGDQVASEGWIETKGVTTERLLDQLSGLPINSVIFTDIDKDGMLEGPNINALQNVAKQSMHPIIASGGIRNAQDIQALKNIKTGYIQGCIIGKAILSEKVALSDLID